MICNRFKIERFFTSIPYWTKFLFALISSFSWIGWHGWWITIQSSTEEQKQKGKCEQSTRERGSSDQSAGDACFVWHGGGRGTNLYCKFVILGEYLILWLNCFASNQESIKLRMRNFYNSSICLHLPFK